VTWLAGLGRSRFLDGKVFLGGLLARWHWRSRRLGMICPELSGQLICG
jgi:hypothetical protein